MRHVYVLTFLLFISLLNVFPSYVSAHTKLQNSSPEPDAKVTIETKEIVMEFNTEVEPLSSFKLIKEGGNELTIGNTEIVDNRMIGTFVEGIPNGIYTVEWKIVGRDGHPIQGDFSFTVTVPIKTTEPSQAPSPSIKPTDPSTEESMIEDRDTALVRDREQAGFWIVTGVITVALIVIIFGKRRKK
ncbi:copper resistance protein CopC [Paenibacillus sp. LHD-38]|uniref:copper resistance CopC family protein n=1 Tax=Paenibacillus sp. LHD-38 TaxID=3072143 RepID=UPI00280DBE93|nr:copper resistance protein CopC [Paenibacillus sp. LHD-38]MDQ8738398.1 copper resistance protein CopC [Paenibacillus sp. LHD-38]